jgi:hypothetical protein
MATKYTGPAIIEDDREQTPLDFGAGVPVIREYLGPLCSVDSLGAFDYSLRGFEYDLRIERKSFGDLVSCCTGDERRRFEAMLDRGRVLRYKALLVEAPWEYLAEPYVYRTPRERFEEARLKGLPPPEEFTTSGVNPASVIGSLIAWSVEYDMHLICCTREMAPALVLKFLTKFASRVLAARKISCPTP